MKHMSIWNYDQEELLQEIADRWNESPGSLYRGGTREEWFELVAQKKPKSSMPCLESLRDLETICRLAHQNGLEYIEEKTGEVIMEMHEEAARILAKILIKKPKLARYFQEEE